MKKNLILIGGGHAHMTALENISRFVEKGYKLCFQKTREKFTFFSDQRLSASS